MKARLVRNHLDNFNGHAALYHVTPPMQSEDDDIGATEYVVVSAIVNPYSGSETYIYPANATGKVVDWLELDGSIRGTLDHAAALAGAGYEIVED